MDAIQILTQPTRRTILRMVWDDERSAGDLAKHFDTTFGAVSQHLSILRRAGFVEVRAEGNHRWYRANRDRLAPYVALLETMWVGVLDDLAAAVESEPE